MVKVDQRTVEIEVVVDKAGSILTKGMQESAGYDLRASKAVFL